MSKVGKESQPGQRKQLIILDLDETLIYAVSTPLRHEYDFEVGPFYVYKRPFVEEFLKMSAQLYQLAVWTSSSEDYAALVVQNLFPSETKPSFVWSRKRCTPYLRPKSDVPIMIKDLKKVKKKGYRLEQVLIVDDSPEKSMRNYGNLIKVKPYLGALCDDELKLLILFLEQLLKVPDVRKIEKRNWKHAILLSLRKT